MAVTIEFVVFVKYVVGGRYVVKSILKAFAFVLRKPFRFHVIYTNSRDKFKFNALVFLKNNKLKFLFLYVSGLLMYSSCVSV